MPIIQKPKEQAVPAKGMINPRAGARAAAAGAEIGKVAIGAGTAMANRGLAQLRQAESNLGSLVQAEKAAMQDAQLSNNLNNAQLEFAKQAAERVQKTTDKHGNPTYDQLPDDVGAIGQDIKSNILKNIKDPKVKAAFEKSFDRYVTNKQISAVGLSRQQKLQFIEESLYKGVDSLVKQSAGDDFSNMGYYENELNSMLDKAVKVGAITPKQAATLREKSISNIRTGQAENLIKNNPQDAVKLLKQFDHNVLGVSKTKHSQLLKRAEARVVDNKIQDSINQNAQEDLQTEQKNLVKKNMEAGVEEGSVGASEIEKAKDEGVLTPEEANRMHKTNIKKKSLMIFETQQMKQISLDLAQGKTAKRFSPAPRAKHYAKRVKYMTDQQGNPPTIQQKAAIAHDYGDYIKPLTVDFEEAALGNSDISANEAIQAWQYLSNNKSQAISNIDKKVDAVYAMASHAIEYTTMDADTAMRKARKAVMSIDDDRRKILVDDFDKEDDFNEDIDDTIISTYGKWYSGDRVDDETVYIFRDLYKQAYLLTGGDKEGTKKLVEKWTSPLVGRSEFNEDKDLIDDDETVMFMPPEHLYPGEDVGLLKRNLHEDVEGMLPEGVSPEDVKIRWDAMSRHPDKPINYGLYYVDEFGQEIPIQDQNGSIARWSPDPERQIEQDREEALTQAQIESKVEAEYGRFLQTEEGQRLNTPSFTRQGEGAARRTALQKKKDEIREQVTEQADAEGVKEAEASREGVGESKTLLGNRHPSEGPEEGVNLPGDGKGEEMVNFKGEGNTESSVPDEEISTEGKVPKKPVRPTEVKMFHKVVDTKPNRATTTSTMSVIKDFEGYRSTPYWDKNAYRIGYGSDTITKADGRIIKVKRGMRINKADAERDLARRTAEFANRARSQVGANVWNKFPPRVKAALTSFAYNYGSLTSGVVRAAKTGNIQQLAAAVRARQVDNNGQNRNRRNKEANIILGR